MLPESNSWNTTGLILEGISGSGKSAVLKALIAHPRFVQRDFLSSLIFSEHQTQRVLEQQERAQGLRPEDSLRLLHDLLTPIRALDRRLQMTDWSARRRSAHRVSYIFERFHLTHACHYAHLSWELVREIDDELSGLGCKLCVLRIDERSVEDRLIRSRINRDWQAYLKKIGASDEAVVDHFLEQQQRLLELCRQSRLEATILDTSASRPEEVADSILDFWKIC